MIKLVHTVVFIVINEQNKVLLLKGVKEKKEEKNDSIIVVNDSQEDKEEWFVPVGNFGEDEDPRVVIKREIKDVLGCDIGECNYFNLYFDSISDNFIKKSIYFYGDILGEINISRENTDFDWVDLEEDEIEKINLPQDQKIALKDFSNFLQSQFMEEID